MKTGINWGQFKNKPVEDQVKMLVGAVQFEMDKPLLCQEMAKHASLAMNSNIKLANEARDSVTAERTKSFLANKYGTSSDTPELVNPANQMAEFFHTNMPELDLGWMLLFDMVDMRNTPHDHFDILDTNAGVAWVQRRPGEKADIRRAISEALTTVSLTEYVAGLGLLDVWLERQMFWKVDEAIGEFRAKYFDLRASNHYALLTALSSGINTAFSVDDTTTANAAMATILRNVRTKGYAAGQSAQFYAVCAVEKIGRLERMLTAQRGSALVDYGTMKEPLVAGIKGIIGTTHLAANDTGWYLVLPNRKMKRGEFKDLTIESARNIYVSAEDIVGKAQFNSAIGDSDQVRRVLYS